MKVLLLLAIAGAGAYYHFYVNDEVPPENPAMEAMERGKTENWGVTKKE